MDHRVDQMVGENFAYSLFIPQVNGVKSNRLSGNFLDVFYRFRFCIAEIVGDNDFISRIQQFDTSVAANKTGAAGNKYFHQKIPFFLHFAFE